MNTLAAATNVVDASRLAILLADIALVLVVGVLFGRLARQWGQPAVVGEMIAGIVLGPSVLGLFPGDLPERIFPADVLPVLSAVAQVGVVLFMFLIGWEFDKRLIKQHLRTATAVSLASVTISFGLGFAGSFVLYPRYSTVGGETVPFLAFAVFLGTAMSVTAFPVLARILTDRGLMKSLVGTVALAGAAIDDVLAWTLLAGISALVSANGDYSRLVWIGALSLVFVVLMLTVVRPLAGRLVNRAAELDRWSTTLVLLCAGAIGSAWLTEWIGIHAIFGAFMFGMIMPREPVKILRRLRDPVNDFSLLLLPVFFVVLGLGVDLSDLSSGDLLALVLILVIACAGKLAGAIFPARMAGMPWREAVDLGVLMNARGLTGLIIINAAVGLGVLDGRMFTMLVVMAIVTTAMTSPLLSRTPRAATELPAHVDLGLRATKERKP